MHEHVKKGDMQTSTFSKKVWGVIANELCNESGTQFTVSQLKSKFNRLRKKHREFSDLIKHTGFGWDPVSCTVTAPDDVWKEYIQAHPGARAYMKRGLDQYDILCEIFNTSTATGELRFSSTQLPQEPEEGHDQGENFMEFGGHNTPVDDDEIFEMMMRTPVRGSNRGKRPRRETTSSEPPRSEKIPTARDRFWEAATVMINEQTARSSASSVMNAGGQSTTDEKWSVEKVIQDALRLDGMKDDILFKCCQNAIRSLRWRQAFLTLLDDKKMGFLRQV